MDVIYINYQSKLWSYALISLFSIFSSYFTIMATPPQSFLIFKQCGDFYWSRQLHPSLCHMFYTSFSPTSASSLIQGHLCHRTVYVICSNRAPGEVAMLTPGTHTERGREREIERERVSHPRSCWIDRITPCGAALTPPGSPPPLSLFLYHPSATWSCHCQSGLPVTTPRCARV